ncbi:hypothetical protein M407DRAFT_212976 [Tulasnella calospora MUT 4182]|uniref:Sugar phosphate transporter domain-containing protein n=1 Tax=Tulasnella calospora MUT 4182 TaxID=1051891 RepID=A0A0C3LSS5_9AGAM|nr:hypothetical protein M407DRAFT_212976 [Tulasnella calospora MUT 4182]
MLPSLRVSIDSLTEIPAQVREFSETGAFWMALYFVFNLGLTLYNKGVLVRFPFPYTLTALHTFCGTVGTSWLWHTGYFTPARLTTKENITLSFFSILYTLNIAISNVSLQLVTVPFHQVVRASAPIPTILITLALLGNRGRGFLGVGKERFLTLIPVMLGVAFATYDDYYFTTWGLILTLLGTFLAALKTVITNMLQTTTKSASLHPLDLLLRMSPLALLQCTIYAYVSGELNGVRNQFTGLGDINMSQRRLWALLVNGCIAFALNIVSLTANRKCGPLSMTVAANVKQVLTICLAVVIFDFRITPTNGMGILLTLLGGMWFGAIEYQEKKAKSMLYVGITHSGEKEKPTSV